MNQNFCEAKASLPKQCQAVKHCFNISLLDIVSRLFSYGEKALAGREP
jgi:hypothetical protein